MLLDNLNKVALTADTSSLWSLLFGDVLTFYPSLRGFLAEERLRGKSSLLRKDSPWMGHAHDTASQLDGRPLEGVPYLRLRLHLARCQRHRPCALRLSETLVVVGTVAHPGLGGTDRCRYRENSTKKIR